MQNLPPGNDDRESELCCLAAEHGYRVVAIYTAECDSSVVEYVLIDLTMGGFGEPLPALEAQGGLDAIADQLAERIDVDRAPVDPAVRVDPFEGGSA
jgi:hypothetical protein